jgi:TRAP transporter TAXI family solute receptor
MHLINIDGKLCDTLMEKCPYYSVQVIPENTYPGQTEEVRTVAVKATIVVAKTLSDEDVYKLTAAIFDHKEDIAAENAQGTKLNLKTATSIQTVPYHAGAARYYKEHGIDVVTDRDFDLEED